MHQEVEEGDEEQLEAVGVDKEHPSSLIITIVGVLNLLLLERVTPLLLLQPQDLLPRFNIIVN